MHNSKLLDAMQSYGINPKKELNSIADGKIHRFQIEGEKSGNKSGWYALHDLPSENITVGAFGDWHQSDDSYKFCSKDDSELTPQQKAQIKKSQTKIALQVAEECMKNHLEAAERANKIWSSASPVKSIGDHPYLKAKGIEHPINIRHYQQSTYGHCLVVPMYGDDEQLCSLQYIFENKNTGKFEKRFLAGGKKGYCVLGDSNKNQRIWVGEGYATGYSLHMANDDAVVVAFDCGNLEPVATHFCETHQNKQIIIAADNDHLNAKNPGLSKAKSIADKLAIPYVYPSFDANDTGSDFNDIHKANGIEAVKQELSNLIWPDIDKVVESASRMDQSMLAIRKKYLAKACQVSMKDFEQLVKQARRNDKEKSEHKGRPYAVDVKPYHNAVDGHLLANEIKSLLRKYLYLPDHADTAITLWIMSSYLYNNFRIFPRLLLTSPEKGCGKTTTMELIGALVNKPIQCSNATVSSIFRSIELWKPTLLIDEADTFIKNNDELRGILNSGHTKSGAHVLRTVGDNHEPKEFSTWAPMLIAMIKLPASTLVDRSIVIELQRKLSDYKLTPMPIEPWNDFSVIRSKIKRFCDDNSDLANYFMPEQVPSHNNERTRNNWMPLLAVANALGDDWTDKARIAFDSIGNPKTASEEIGYEILSDIKSVFDDKGYDRIATKDLISALCEIEDAPWASWNYGRSLSPRSLSKLLTPYQIAPKNLKIDYKQSKGYAKSMFTDSWQRYLKKNEKEISIHPKLPVASVALPSLACFKPNDTNGFSGATDTTDFTGNSEGAAHFSQDNICRYKV